MILQGIVIDKLSEAKIPFASIRIVLADGTYTGIGTAADSQGNFYLDTQGRDDNAFIQVSSVGYQTVMDLLYPDYNIDWTGIIALQRMTQNLPPVVVVSKKKNNNWLLLLAAIPFLINDDKDQKVGKVDTSTMLTVGAGFLLLTGMGLIKSLLSSLGIQETSGATAEQSNPGSPWNPDFWQQQDTWVRMGLIARRDEFHQYRFDLQSAFGIFSDDFEQVKGVFDKLHSKAEVSYLSFVMKDEASADLLTFLKTGGGILPWDGLSDAHLKILIDYVKALPTT